jgi:hypothetical protein
MRNMLHATFASAAALALAACGSSQDADEAATADSVEMPAEEAMTDATGMPSDMATGMATGMASDMAMPTDTMSGAAATETAGSSTKM